jgi:hypothetical protein
MSRILEATCSASGVVTAEGFTLTDVEIMSEGAQASEGVLVIDGEVKKYIPSGASSDLKTTLTKLSSSLDDISAALSEVADALTAIGAVTGPSWTPPPSLTTSAATINSKVAEIDATKGEVDTLKDALK